MTTGNVLELPQYQCIKKVRAIKIRGIRGTGGLHPQFFLESEDPTYGEIEVDFVYFKKHEPKIGGYFVLYDDGYKSYSPAQAFESGYIKV